MDFNWFPPTFKEQIKSFIFEEVTGFESRSGHNFSSRVIVIADKWAHFFFILWYSTGWASVSHPLTEQRLKLSAQSLTQSEKSERQNSPIRKQQQNRHVCWRNQSSQKTVCCDQTCSVSRGPPDKKRPYMSSCLVQLEMTSQMQWKKHWWGNPVGMKRMKRTNYCKDSKIF